MSKVINKKSAFIAEAKLFGKMGFRKENRGINA
jgi:hypothetical protein